MEEQEVEEQGKKVVVSKRRWGSREGEVGEGRGRAEKEVMEGNRTGEGNGEAACVFFLVLLEDLIWSSLEHQVRIPLENGLNRVLKVA